MKLVGLALVAGVFLGTVLMATLIGLAQAWIEKKRKAK